MGKNLAILSFYLALLLCVNIFLFSLKMLGEKILTCVQRRFLKTFKEPWNRFLRIYSASLYSLAVRYDTPIPTRFLAPIDCSKIPAQYLCICVLAYLYLTHRDKLFIFK
jgi:hypothetical protein